MASQIADLRLDPALSGVVAEVLEKIDAPTNLAIGALLDIVDDDPRAATALGKYPDPSAVTALHDCLLMNRHEKQALESLGRIGSLAAATAPTVRHWIHSPTERLRHRAAVVLYLITGEHALPDEVDDPERDAAQLLADHWVRLRPFGDPFERVRVSRLDAHTLRADAIVPKSMCASPSRPEASDTGYRLIAPLIEELRQRGFAVEAGCWPKNLVEAFSGG